MTVGELMNTLIQAVDCDGVDTETQITFYIPAISEDMCNFKLSKIDGRTLGTNYCILILK